MRRAFKVRAYPDIEQAAILRRTFGCVRVVWNRTLADRQRRYTTEQRSTTYKETDAYDLNTITGWQEWARDRVSVDPKLLPELMPLLDTINGVAKRATVRQSAVKQEPQPAKVGIPRL
jgi:hypothetical protein